MRYIPTNCLRVGQVLAHNLILDSKRLMLRKGIPLTDGHIQKISQLGFQGVYIDDNLSADIQIANLISNELKQKINREVRSMFVDAEISLGRRAFNNMDRLKDVVGNIVDEIMHDKDAMVNIVDIRAYDDYTFSHSINVALLSCILGTVLGLDKISLNELTMGALLHDIGKVFIDKRIINKPSKLTPEELEQARRHSILGYNYLSANRSIPETVKVVARTHHEQFSGQGYPAGLSGKQIHLYSRVVSIADVYDALVSDRPYRRAMLPSDAMEYIMSGYNTMFDPDIVAAFTRRIAPYPLGTCVKLSNGEIGIVVYNYEFACLRPKIRIIRDKKPIDEYIDLAKDYSTLNVTITEIANI
jgi:putative nucleotidyltransferase with HDIG domain